MPSKSQHDTATAIPSAIEDWNDAYNNVGYIPNAMEYIEQCQKDARAFRTQSGATEQDYTVECDIPYGKINNTGHERQVYDYFVPKTKVKGLFIFVHGGYWYRFDKSFFSHLAQGPLSKGYVVAMPAYPLCPHVTVPEITQAVSVSITTIVQRFDKDFEGKQTTSPLPIVLCGHSAGGHLVTRQVCEDTTLDSTVLRRISWVLSISGVHDLRPVLKIVQNNTIHLNPSDAAIESPALLKPWTAMVQDAPLLKLTCLVGSLERPEFIRQSDLLANIWKGLGVATASVHVPNRNHFDIIEDLQTDQGLIASILE